MKGSKMKDEYNREKGKYTETFTKVIDDVTYTKVETTVIGRNSEIMNFQREYTPGIKFPNTWESL
jgi:hypothetical protein